MTRSKELNAIRLHGKRIRTAHLEVRYITSPLRDPRAGIIVPRYAHKAVARNLLKRRLREIVRLDVLPLLEKTDLVVRILPSAYQASFDELREECLLVRGQLTLVTA